MTKPNVKAVVVAAGIATGALFGAASPASADALDATAVVATDGATALSRTLGSSPASYRTLDESALVGTYTLDESAVGTYTLDAGEALVGTYTVDAGEALVGTYTVDAFKTLGDGKTVLTQ